MPELAPQQPALNDSAEALLWACDQRDPRTLPAGLVNAGRNLRFTNGVPETRKGVVKPAWANLIDSGNIKPLGTPHGSGEFRDPNSVEWQFVAAGGYVWRTRPHNANQTVALPPGVRILSNCHFVQAFNLLFLFRGRYLAPLVMPDYDTGFADLLPHYNPAIRYNAVVVATGQAADEMAYGPYLAVTSVTRVDSTVTVVTNAAHGYVTGADVELKGATQTDYNGRWNITVLDEVTFTFTLYTSPTTPATGTILVSNMAYYWQAKGSRVTLTTLTGTGSTATATKVAHGFSAGQYVTISGATPAAFNGTFPVDTVADADTFTYLTASPVSGSATGTILAQTSVVFAGQTPDSHPEAWTRTYNILPNAETALFINDLLLVPTAYEPASVDNYATFSGGTYKKVDYLVATNYLDYIHFSFANVFRINAGSADEIVDLFKFGAGTVIVLKGSSWAVLSAVALDLTQITLDVRSQEFGCVARGACGVVGSNGYFVAPKVGLMVIRQSELGTLLSVNVPLSAPIQKTIDRIDWTRKAAIRLAHWDNKLYLSAPMKDGTPTIMVYDFVASVRLGIPPDAVLQTQGWTPLDTSSALSVQEFHRLHLNGEERLLFLDDNGFVNLMEESDRGDHVALSDGTLGWEELETYMLSRMYDPSLRGQVRPTEEAFSLATFNPSYSVAIVFAGVNVRTEMVTAKTRSQLLYDRPFDALPWDPSNVNDDWATPYRQDYRVTLPAGGLNLGRGVGLLQYQESLDTRPASGRQSKGFQLEFTNTQGRVRLIGQRSSAVSGRDRKGILT